MADFLTPPPATGAAAPSMTGAYGQPQPVVEWYTSGDSAASASYAAPPSHGHAGGYTGGYGSMGDGKIGGGDFSSGANYGTFDDEPPLLEELGIDIGSILTKVKGVLTFRMRHDYVANLDIGGPLLFILSLSSLHLLTGKLHFGVILGWSVVGSMAMYWMVNMLSGIDATTKIDIYNTCALMGYAMLPLCIFSAVDLVLPRGTLSVVLAATVVLWCSLVAAKMFVIYTPSLLDHRILVVYPCILFYSAFMLLSFY